MAGISELSGLSGSTPVGYRVVIIISEIICAGASAVAINLLNNKIQTSLLLTSPSPAGAAGGRVVECYHKINLNKYIFS